LFQAYFFPFGVPSTRLAPNLPPICFLFTWHGPSSSTPRHFFPMYIAADHFLSGPGLFLSFFNPPPCPPTSQFVSLPLFFPFFLGLASVFLISYFLRGFASKPPLLVFFFGISQFLYFFLRLPFGFYKVQRTFFPRGKPSPSLSLLLCFFEIFSKASFYPLSNQAPLPIQPPPFTAITPPATPIGFPPFPSPSLPNLSPVEPLDELSPPPLHSPFL